MEYQVLDNLPHDLVYSPDQVSPWMEVWIEKVKGSSQASEVYKPLQDPLISRCVDIIGMNEDKASVSEKLTFAAKGVLSKVFPKPRRAWLPTGCLKLMDTLHQALPSMSLIASDFSYLPDVSIPGDRAPLVSSKDGKTSDHRNYFDAQGDADIFFPTDFRLLEQIDHNCAGFSKEQKNPGAFKPVKKRRTIILDTAAFMEEFGMPLKTRTKDGYNPLLDDFKNTKFYLSVPTHNVPTHSRRN
uniref:Protein arginine methyltransferase NDUFAF7 n=1 Tax=Zea mays TaxID=4577 RepID=C0P2W3_MAIZE|nr:unknown [Zea mays]